MPEIDVNDIVQEPAPPMTLEETVVVPAEELEDDMVLLTIREDDVPEQVLKAVLYGLAEEQGSLRSLRIRKQNDGKDTSHISVKRGTLLKYMSETLLQKQALTGGSMSDIDLRGPRFRAIFKMFLKTISDTFDEVKIPREYKELFFQALSQNMEGWETKAEKLAKKVGSHT